MATYPNFAGRTTNVVDGNLGSEPPVDLVSVLVIGTASQGVSEKVYTVTSKAAAKEEFGVEGTLLQGMYEAFEGGAPMVRLYRIGGSNATVVGIGGGITLTIAERKEDVTDDYKLSWDGAVLTVWRIDTLTTGTKVYEADFSGTFPVVTTNVNFEVSAVKTTALDAGATKFGLNGSDGTTGDSTFTDAQPISTDGVNNTTLTGASITITDATTGVDMTRKELYVALNEAYLVLQDYNLHFIHPMDVYLDDYNAADVVDLLSGGQTVAEYFGTDDYLGFLQITEDGDGNNVYTWSDTSTPGTNHEVNFAYQLANFCHQMTYNELMVHGVVNVRLPASMAQGDVVKWVGKAPTYENDVITANGTGLLGNKFMAGRTDWTPGFYATETEFLDDTTIVQDRNGNDIDIGRYLSVYGTVHSIVNPYAKLINRNSVSYIACGGAFYAGMIAALNPKDGPSYKKMASSISVPYVVSKAKLNDLAGYHYVVLRPMEGGFRVADGWTAAQNTSDYRRFTTFNIVKYCDRELRKIIDDYIGKGVTLQIRESLKGRIDGRFNDIIKEGILQAKTFTVTATKLEAANGILYIFGDLVPAFELRSVPVFFSVQTASVQTV